MTLCVQCRVREAILGDSQCATCNGRDYSIAKRSMKKMLGVRSMRRVALGGRFR